MKLTALALSIAAIPAAGTQVHLTARNETLHTPPVGEAVHTLPVASA